MRVLVLAAALALLGGCGTLDGMWDSDARAACERENDIPSRQACQDRADRISRERDDR